MRYDNACDIVAGSELMSAVNSRFGNKWVRILWVRVMVMGFVGALEGTNAPDEVLDEMKDAARLIRNAPAAA